MVNSFRARAQMRNMSADCSVPQERCGIACGPLTADSPKSKPVATVGWWSARLCRSQDPGESALLHFTVFNFCDDLVRCDAETNASTYVELLRCP